MEENNEILEPEESQGQPQQQQPQQNSLAQRGRDELAKQAREKAMKNAGKQAAVKGKMAVAMGPVIFWGTVIIVALIIIIGIIMFFATMPGMVMEKLKEIGKAIANAWNSWWGSDDTEQVDDEQIYEALDYLDEMGYDLKGFGFLTEYVGDKKDGVVRGEDSSIVKAKSDFIKAYLASDNYVYTIKNHNLVTDNGWQAFWQHVVNFFGGAFDEQLTRGLIAIYKEGSKGLGDRGDFYQDTSAFNSDDISLDVAKKKLTLKRGSNNQAMEYDLDGWTGRYGMPIDFLMSVHIATMMPDLAYDMTTNFDTEIVLILRSIDDAKISTAFWNGSDYITYEDMKAAASEDTVLLIFNDTNDLTRKEAQKAMIEFNIHSPDNCENNPPCSEDAEREECCGTCEAYMQRILDELTTPHDDDFDYYVPYIESVKNHWYRDVYYAINEKNTAEYKEKMGKEKIEFVKYDYDYEAIMKERWTLYKTDEDGNFKLYALNSDGKYATSTSEIENYAPDKFKKDDETDYYIFTGDADEQKRVLQGQSEGLRYNVSKMAETFNKTDSSSLEDLGWSDEYSTLWTAYEEEDSSSTEWENLYPDDTDEVKINIFTKKTSENTIAQKGEGQRAETNYQIKKMFLENYYFRYDGTQSKAELITRMREENDIDYGPLSEEDLKKVIISDDLKSKYTAKDLAGQVTINQDSLNAFSMLENTHTLDSDYIYRDFKELIVELGYFDKEELVDEVPRILQWIVPDTNFDGFPNRIIDKRENEYGTMIHSKGDISCVTLEEVESVIDSGLSQEIIEDFEEEFPNFNVGEEVELDPTHNYFEKTSTTRGSVDLSVEEFIEATKDMCQKINAAGYDYCAKGQCRHNVHGNACGLSESFPESYKQVATRNFMCVALVSWALQYAGIMPDEDNLIHDCDALFRYCVIVLGGEIIRDGEALESGDILFYGTDVANYDFGHTEIVGEEREGEEGFYKYDGGHSTAEMSCIQKFNRLIVREESFVAVRLPWGNLIKNKYCGYNGNEAVTSPVTGILLEYGTYSNEVDSITNEEYRINVDLKYGVDLLPRIGGDDEEEGEEDTEPEPVNTDETPFESKIVADKVGYAKILVLNDEYYQNLEQSTDNQWNIAYEGKSLLGENGKYREELLDKETLESDDWSDMDRTIYGYKEEAEKYKKAGISGYIVFIDGFICEYPDDNLDAKDVDDTLPYEGNEEGRAEATLSMDFSGGVSFKSITTTNFADEKLESSYRGEKVTKLVSSSATEKLKAESTAIASASPTLYLTAAESMNDEELVYIKAGTIIGRTMTDKELLEASYLRNGEYGLYSDYRSDSTDGEPSIEEENVIGNYVRIIMRDEDKTPVENVENYMRSGVKTANLDEIEMTEDEIRFIAGVCCAANTPAYNEGTDEQFEQAIAACAWAFRCRYEKTAEKLCSPWYFNNGGDPHAKDYLDRIKPIYFACSQDFGTNKKSAAEVNNVTGQTPVSYTVKETGITYWANGPWEESIDIVKAVFAGEYDPIVKDSDSWKSNGLAGDESAFYGTPLDEVIMMPEGLGNNFFCYGGVHLDKYR